MRILCLLLFCIFCASHLFSQDKKDSVTQLQQVTVLSNRYKVDAPSPSLRIQTPLLQLPQNIQVITDLTLRDQQVFDMLEGAIRNISGASRNDSWDNYANIIMRGSPLTAFRNGMNVKMPWGPLLEDMSIVERIEFVKGPSGFMLASGEPSGIYNVVTKKPTGINKGEVTFSLGSFDTYRTTLDLDGKLNKDGKLLYRLNVMGQTKNSHRDFEFNKRYSIVPVLTYQFNDKTSLTAEYMYQYMQMSMLGSSYIFSANKYGDLPKSFSLLEPNLDPTNIKDHSFQATLNHQLNNDWKLTTQIGYLNSLQTGASMWLAYPIGVEKDGNMNRSVSNWDAFNEAKNGQVFINGKISTGRVNHKILGGLDVGNKSYYADFYQIAGLRAYDIYGNVLPFFNIYEPVHGFVPQSDMPKFDRSVPLKQRAGGTYGESSTSLYIQDELGFMDDKIRLTLAGRYTALRQQSFGTYSDDEKFTPRAGISISLDNQTSVYGLYDQAFVAQQGADSTKKPFVPVTGNNIEAGIKRDWFGGKWNSTFSIYRIIKNNVVTYIPGPGFKSLQTGQTKTEGIELDVRGEITRGFNINFNYAYTHGEITKDEDPEKIGGILPGVGFPKHISNAWLSYRISEGKSKGLGVSLGYQYQWKRHEQLPDYFRLDGGVSWQGPQFTVAINANNLLNKYLFMGSLYDHNNDISTDEYNFQVEPGINFRMTIAYKF